MVQPTAGFKTGAVPARIPNVPSHLTKEISTFEQFQERIQALVNEYNVPLVGGCGPIMIPSNGGTAYTWSAQLHTPIGAGLMQPLASDNGPVLEKCINRVLEDAAYHLAAQKALTPSRSAHNATPALKVKTGT